GLPAIHRLDGAPGLLGRGCDTWDPALAGDLVVVAAWNRGVRPAEQSLEVPAAALRARDVDEIRAFVLRHDGGEATLIVRVVVEQSTLVDRTAERQSAVDEGRRRDGVRSRARAVRIRARRAARPRVLVVAVAATISEQDLEDVRARIVVV